MTEIAITSVPEFHAAVRAGWKNHGVYRGETRTDNQLSPKIGRLRAVNPWNNLHRERAALNDFKRQAVPFLQYRPSTDWEWLALAQHHGLPTRMLDWTRNPLIAAYFATLPPYTMDSAIYVIDFYEFPEPEEHIHPLDSKVDSLYVPPHFSTRFVAQQGIFTVHHRPEMPLASTTLQKWTLKKECLIELSTALGTYGISAATVFPDLSGTCQDLADHWTTEFTSKS